MNHGFLSYGWLQAARGVQEEVAGSLRGVGADIRMNVAVEDCPPTAECTFFHLQVTPEGVDFAPVWAEAADATVYVAYRTARQVLTTGSMDVALGGILNGAITVDGDFMAVIRFGGVMATDGSLVSADIGRRLSLITELDEDDDREIGAEIGQ